MFKTSRFIATQLNDLRPVVQDIEQHFTALGYQVTADNAVNGFFISLSKGGVFKAVLGMKTALNIELEKTPGGWIAEAGVGIFGQQMLPSVISMFIAWPVLLTQITGMVQQSKLDDEAIEVVEQGIRRIEIQAVSMVGSGKIFCTNCGASLEAGFQFCNKCGAKAM